MFAVFKQIVKKFIEIADPKRFCTYTTADNKLIGIGNGRPEKLTGSRCKNRCIT